MIRLLRLLPVLIPIVTAALRMPKVRSFLHLKPLGADTQNQTQR